MTNEDQADPLAALGHPCGLCGGPLVWMHEGAEVVGLLAVESSVPVVVCPACDGAVADHPT